jgi:hypothetical protein
MIKIVTTRYNAVGSGIQQCQSVIAVLNACLSRLYGAGAGATSVTTRGSDARNATLVYIINTGNAAHEAVRWDFLIVDASRIAERCL